MNDAQVTYRHSADMREISGFGGGYEKVCQDMLEAGVKWLASHPKAQIVVGTFSGIFGVLIPESDHAKALEKVVVDASGGECTGAMFHTVMLRLQYIAQNGWPSYCVELRRKSTTAAEG